MTWGEVDFTAGCWTVPAVRMKGGREHRVPLSADALRLLQSQTPAEAGALVFAGVKERPLSDMTLAACLRRMKVDAVPHGFRSTFRDWAAEVNRCPAEVAEAALAHAIGDKVEAAYRRGDLLDRRRELMDAWAAYCRGGAEVVQLRVAA
jgi:integrase